VQNSEGGTRILGRDDRPIPGDLELALAAYNAGPETVRRFQGVPAVRGDTAATSNACSGGTRVPADFPLRKRDFSPATWKRSGILPNGITWCAWLSVAHRAAVQVSRRTGARISASRLAVSLTNPRRISRAPERREPHRKAARSARGQGARDDASWMLVSGGAYSAWRCRW